MCDRIISNIVLLILAIIYANPIPAVFAQSEPAAPPQLKDFGSSLKKNKRKINDADKSAGKQASETPDDEVIKVDTNLVLLNVLVADQKGHAISGLKKGDFIVTENSVAQNIEHFYLGDSLDIPRSIVLIIDFSSSQNSYIRTSINAAEVLIDKLNPKDRMAIVTDDAKLIVNFTHDKELLKKKLKVAARRTGLGESMQYNALMATLNELFDQEDIRPIIIFQTDGDQASSIPHDRRETKRYSWTGFTYNDLFNRIEKSRATIYSIIPGYSAKDASKVSKLFETIQNSKDPYSVNADTNSVRDQAIMTIVAQDSGGFTSGLAKPEQAERIYTNILEEINSRYLIGYYPNNLEHDGKRRDVKIEIRDHPEYQILGRKSYIAPK